MQTIVQKHVNSGRFEDVVYRLINNEEFIKIIKERYSKQIETIWSVNSTSIVVNTELYQFSINMILKTICVWKRIVITETAKGNYMSRGGECVQKHKCNMTPGDVESIFDKYLLNSRKL